MKLEAKVVPLSIYSLQPISSRVLHFSQDLKGPMPDLSKMYMMADAAIVPYEDNKTVLSVALCIVGYQRIESDKLQFSFDISTTTEFIRLNQNFERQEFPRLLDIDLEPFDTAVSLAIGLTRGHLLPRFQGSAWPDFILPAISIKGLSKALKARDTQLAKEASKIGDKTDNENA